MESKLTLVSIYAKGVRKSFFFKLPYVNGKAVMPHKFLSELLMLEFNLQRGDTYSIG